MTITYFVHGTTTDNEQELATGWLPGELSAKGREEARILANLYKGQQFDIIICSDLQRAVESAELGFAGVCQILQDWRLRECNYGDWNGVPNYFKNNLTDYVDSPFPNGECLHDVETRVGDLLKDIREKYDGKQLAFIAHQAPQLALEVLLNGKTWPDAIATDWRNTRAWQPGWRYTLS